MAKNTICTTRFFNLKYVWIFTKPNLSLKNISKCYVVISLFSSFKTNMILILMCLLLRQDAIMQFKNVFIIHLLDLSSYMTQNMSSYINDAIIDKQS